MTTQTGTYQTAFASKYLQQLCKHFAHKVEVTFSATHGVAAMPFGAAIFDATDDRLTVTIKGVAEADREKARHVVDIHLQKFAFREEFEAMHWEETADA